jgi:endonuclease/exonuclease/phosphatase family metal-dependent hydrolase
MVAHGSAYPARAARNVARVRVRVASYNIRRCEGLDGRVDPPRTAAVLVATGAEVMGLQELDSGLPRSGNVDQPSLLEAAIGLPVLFHPALEFGGGRYGIALAGEGLAGLDAVTLPGSPGNERRVAVWARRDGITYVCTHLSLDPPDRALQTEALAKLCRGLAPPIVVLGDLNQTKRSLGPLFASGLRPGPGRHLTHSAAWPRHQIDWALAGGGARVTRSWTLSSRASDHRPLVAVVET